MKKILFPILFISSLCLGQQTIRSIVHDSVASDTGSFKLVLTGVVGADTVKCKYSRIGQRMHFCIPPITDTSNAITCTLTGIPTGKRPANNHFIICPSLKDSSKINLGGLVIGTGGIIQPKFKSAINSAYTTTFNSVGIKGISDSCEVDYNLQ
jgi:hypothetical protein